jgi:O-antigen/teichoic acid export membrane protein
MTTLAHRAVVISATRLVNLLLMFVGPVILVRLLSVEEFGTLREFQLYGAILTSLAGFNISSSLLYFAPAHPSRIWRFVQQSVVLVAANSLVVVALFAAIDRGSGGAIVGPMLLPVIAYTLFFINVDFWEYLWLGQRQVVKVPAYSLTRQGLRLATIVVCAWLGVAIDQIVWLLVVLEGLRLGGSILIWRRLGSDLGPPQPGSWRLQFAFCWPLGVSLVLITVTRNGGDVFVAELIGPAALAQYAIGTSVVPMIVALRNSLSDVILPELADQHRSSERRSFELWQRTSIAFAVLLLPVAVLLACFAKEFIAFAFSDAYLPAVPVFQICLLLMVRDCFDFGILVRALNQNQFLLQANAISCATTVVLLPVLVPSYGLVGAALAHVAARYIDGAYLAWRVSAAYRRSHRGVVPWKRFLIVAASAAVAGLPLIGDFWIRFLGALGGPIVAALLYAALFIWLLRIVGVPEAAELGAKVLSLLRNRKS